jgi:hypothetical protein
MVRMFTTILLPKKIYTKQNKRNPKPKTKNKRAEMFSVVIITWEGLHSSNMGVSSTCYK